MKVVPDSMMWVSYCVSQEGYRHRALNRAIAARVRLFTSAYILNETSQALIEDFGRSSRQVLLAGKAILRMTRLVKLPDYVRSFVPGDPNDDPIVQTAITAKADCLVTADKVLLAVAKIRDVEIITLDEFVARLPVET